MVVQQLLGPNGLVYSVEDEQQNIKVLWGGRLFYSFNRNDAFAKRLGIVLLANLGVLQKTIGEIFAVDRQTTRAVVRLYREEGVQGLRDRQQGPPPVGDELKEFVINKYVELNNRWGYQQEILQAVRQKVDEGLFSKGISRSMLHKIVREHKAAVQQERERKEAQRQSREEREHRRQQERSEEQRRREEEELRQPQLPQGEQRCVQHGGAAATIPLVGKLGMVGFLPESEASEEQKLFDDAELAISYVALNAAELVEVEQDFKLLGSYQMGGIIGRVKLPSLSLYRQRIAQVVGQMDMRQVMVQAAMRAQGLLGFSKVLYIDGHFMPYYGSSATLYGYSSQKRLAMHGREYFFVHDENGLPVYATISDGYRDMRHYIEQVDEKLRAIYRVGEKQLVEVFDRGGYAKSFCVGIAEKIRFICWRSDARQVPKIRSSEWVEVVVQRQPNEYGQQKHKRLEAWERQRLFSVAGRTARMREIWVKDGCKVSPALTNDFKRSLPDVVAALTRRWGAQENMFKELKQHGIDRIHSYRKEPYSEKFLYEAGLEEESRGVRHEISNPKLRQLNRQIAKLRADKRRIAEKIAKLEQAGKNAQAKQLKGTLAGITRKITTRINRRAHLPKKVRMMDRIEEEHIVRLADEKKLFFDWLKINSIWAKRQLVELVKPYYKDLRDVNKFVRSVLRSRTYVCQNDDVLCVSFPPQHSPKGATALQAMCDYLNARDSPDLGLRFSRIDFRVGEKH